MFAQGRADHCSPPRFLRLAGHPLRWRLLSELARSDRRVGELCERADQRQSLVSYHLRQLRDGGLVSARRSLADGPDSYYVLELARCRELLVSAGASLHPGLAPAVGSPRAAVRGVRRVRVLFLCTGNSARSQMAEALAQPLSGGVLRAVSAGSRPKPLHPNAVRVMRERGIDLTGRRSKHLSEFTSQRFDYVISLCDRVREICPEFPGAPEAIHWSVRDPAREPGDNDETLHRPLRLFAAYSRCPRGRRRGPGPPTSVAERARQLGRTAHARRAHTPAGRLEPDPSDRR